VFRLSVPAAMRRLALAWGFPMAKEMHALPDDLAARLNEAQDALEAAAALDADVKAAQDVESQAQADLNAKAEKALSGHQDANAKATAALAALKTHFGLT
jgi:hypothetical protein